MENLEAYQWPTLEWAVKAFLSHFGLGVLTALILCLIFERVTIVAEHRKGFTWACVVGFWGGMVSVGIDIDHIVLLLGATYSRPLHWPVLGIICVPVIILGGFTLLMFALIKKARDPNDALFVRRLIYAVCLCVCLAVHVIEDFTLGWF